MKRPNPSARAVGMCIAVLSLIASTSQSRAAISTFSASLDFQDLAIIPSGGTLEILTPFQPELHLHATAALDWPAEDTRFGPNDFDGGVFAYKFVIHPDATHNIGDFVSTTFTFLFEGTTEAITPAPVSQVAGWAEVEGVIEFWGQTPTGQTTDYNAVSYLFTKPSAMVASDPRYPMNLFDTGDFRITNWSQFGLGDELTLGVGYEYTVLVGGSVRAVQIEVPNGVPDGGQSGMMLAISLITLGMGRKSLRRSAAPTVRTILPARLIPS
ncbi:MAG TPA: hypothetical protein VG796_07045 [Verrucomicrobiales bacterium]|nr:hypothetical protein [Verrucomicrobiales bacterium]